MLLIRDKVSSAGNSKIVLSTALTHPFNGFIPANDMAKTHKLVFLHIGKAANLKCLFLIWKNLIVGQYTANGCGLGYHSVYVGYTHG